MPSPANAGPARHDAATINQKRISAPFATCGDVTVGTWTGKCRERFALDSAFLPSGGAVFPLCSKCRWRRTDRSRPADANQYYGELIRYHEWMMGFVSGFNAAYEDDLPSQIRVDLASLDVLLRK